jgi:hypothetical protein
VLERYGNARDSLVRCAASHDVPDLYRESIGEAIALLRIIKLEIEKLALMKILADWTPQDLTKAFLSKWTTLRGRA